MRRTLDLMDSLWRLAVVVVVVCGVVAANAAEVTAPGQLLSTRIVAYMAINGLGAGMAALTAWGLFGA